MTHNDRLPDMRFGAGLLNKLGGEDVFVLPMRDNGPIAMPKRLDGQMGIKERDESIEEAQAREGTEETAFVKETENKAYLGVPSTIRDTDLETNLVDTYETARMDEESPLPKVDGLFYFDATQKVPDGMPTFEAEDDGYETGYTWENSDDVSMELMNDNEISFGLEEILEGNISVYDIENMETEDGAVHFDRPTAILEPKEDRISVFRGGELEYEGNVANLEDFLREEYGWDMKDVDTAATAKVQARLDAYDDIGNQTEEYFTDERYLDALEELGNMFEGFPSP